MPWTQWVRSSPIHVKFFVTLMFQAGIRRILTAVSISAFSTFIYPFLFAADFLVILFWLEILTQKKIEAISNLKRLRIPFFCFIAYLTTVEIIVFSMRYLAPDQSWPGIVSFLNIFLVLLAISISVVVIIVRLRKRQSSGLIVNKRLQRMTRKMIAMAVLSIATLLTLLATLFVFTGQTPWFVIIIMLVAALLVCSMTIVQIHMFAPGGKANNYSTTRNANGTDSRSSKDKRASSISNDGATSLVPTISRVASGAGTTGDAVKDATKETSTESSSDSSDSSSSNVASTSKSIEVTTE